MDWVTGMKTVTASLKWMMLLKENAQKVQTTATKNNETTLAWSICFLLLLFPPGYTSKQALDLEQNARL
jgi:hypothetical protein